MRSPFHFCTLIPILLVLSVRALNVRAHDTVAIDVIDVDSRRQMDTLKRMKNFMPPDEQHSSITLDERVNIWIRKGVDKLTEDRIEFLLVHKKVASADTVHRAVLKVRASRREWTDDSPEPKTLSLAKALVSLSRSGEVEVVQQIVAKTMAEAKEQILQENVLLERLLREHTSEKRTMNELLASALSKGSAADPKAFRAALDEVELRMEKETKRRQSCFVVPMSSPVKRNNELDWMAKLYGPDFEERVRIYGTINQARRQICQEKNLLSRYDLAKYDDDKQMISRLLDLFANETYFKVARFRYSDLKEAMAIARRTSVVVNAVRYGLVLALRGLLSNGDQYEKRCFRGLAKLAVEYPHPRVLETLMEFSDSPNEDFKEALITLVQLRVKSIYTPVFLLDQAHLAKASKVMEFLINHKLAISPAIDEAYKLAVQGEDHYIARKLEKRIKKDEPNVKKDEPKIKKFKPKIKKIIEKFAPKIKKIKPNKTKSKCSAFFCRLWN